jgi:hypothetical protein
LDQVSQPVECYSGSQYAERPLALWWQGQRLSVAAVLAQWRSPTGAGFRVQTESGSIFDVLYDELKDEWSVHPL